MRTWKKLYKLSSAGKVQEWQIKAFMRDDVGVYETTHGQLNGKMQTTEVEVKEGKNIGRANETTVWEQTLSEATSKWQKQIDRKGYSLTIPKVSDKKFRPMLAKSFNKPGLDLFDLKDGKHITYPCYYQPKLDGIRCNAMFVDGEIQLLSRQGKAFTALNHIADHLSNCKAFDEHIILDGELYIHDEEFQELVGSIKRDTPNSESKKVQYHIYDVFSMKKPDLHFEERLAFKTGSIVPNDIIKLVKTGKVNEKKDVSDFLSLYVNKGYEGIMLRNKLGAYKVDGRSKDLQKVKQFIEMEFEIIGAEQNKGKMNKQCSFVCITKDGAEFKVKPEGDELLREKYWSDWQRGIIKPGAKLTVMFFAWTTSKNPVPRFPVGKILRNYEE